MVFYRLLFVAAIVGLLCAGNTGCTTTEFAYVDPARPEATVSLKRTTFLRHGTVTVDFPINAQVRIDDRPISGNLTVLVAGLGCLAGGILGAPAGPLGAGLGCLGGGAIGGAAGALGGEDDKPSLEEAPPLKPLERPPILPAPKVSLGASWREFECGGAMEPDWCR
jgi:hypothetical protein